MFEFLFDYPLVTGSAIIAILCLYAVVGVLVVGIACCLVCA